MVAGALPDLAGVVDALPPPHDDPGEGVRHQCQLCGATQPLPPPRRFSVQLRRWGRGGRGPLLAGAGARLPDSLRCRLPSREASARHQAWPVRPVGKLRTLRRGPLPSVRRALRRNEPSRSGRLDAGRDGAGGAPLPGPSHSQPGGLYPVSGIGLGMGGRGDPSPFDAPMAARSPDATTLGPLIRGVASRVERHLAFPVSAVGLQSAVGVRGRSVQ